jgi:hypothetical protein
MTQQNATNAVTPLSPLKQAFLALAEAEARVDELERAADEPIAVIGIGCRIPCGEDGPEGYWQMLREQRGAVRDRVQQRFAAALGDASRVPALPEVAGSGRFVRATALWNCSA